MVTHPIMGTPSQTKLNIECFTVREKGTGLI